ncbi:MAG TPA: pteridine reductase [Gammaproteobacteria bacterium]|nr:pteridine reductase [Gammaproteobacteria bacterium]
MANDTASHGNNLAGRVVLITGAGRRLGAATARYLHAIGMNVVIHYHHSAFDARALADDLNTQRPNSAITLQADLLVHENLAPLIEQAAQQWNRLDALINNASAFYPTPLVTAPEQLHSQWNELMGSNLHAPFFLSTAAALHLQKTQGSIINLLDSNLNKPMTEHSIYLAAKAGLASLTRSLALELAPDIRVNAIAPGAILWPEADAAIDEAQKQKLLSGIPLNRTGTPNDIAQAIAYLLSAPYVSGHTLAIDGGRSI